jgi:hypothetical protein
MRVFVYRTVPVQVQFATETLCYNQKQHLDIIYIYIYIYIYMKSALGWDAYS